MPKHPFLIRGRGPLTFAHRGGSTEVPESTLPAFRHARQVGVDVLELDAHLTRDDHIVVMHDTSVDRTTDGHGQIADLTFATVRSLDAGYHFSPPGKPGSRPWRGTGVQVPTLSEILDEFGEQRLNIDVKPNSLELASRVVSELRYRGMETQVCLASWHLRVCRYLAEVASEFCLTCPPLASLGLLLSGEVGLPRTLVPWDTLQIPVELYGLRFVTEQTVGWFHAQGLDVHVWTVDDPSSMRWLMDLGVDGIMTDRPSLLVSELRRWESAVSTPQ